MNFISRLMPREGRFFNLFDNHAKLIVDGALALADVLRHYDNGKDRAVGIKSIEDAEHGADRITHETVQLLHTTFVTPFDRDDIHRLITRMDDVMDFVESASERLALYELEEMTPEVQDLSRVLVRATEAAATAVAGLADLKKSQAILDACIEVNRLENEADEILRNAVAKLFRQATDPLLVMKWKEVYEALEEATDRCEDVANLLEGVVVKNA